MKIKNAPWMRKMSLCAQRRFSNESMISDWRFKSMPWLSASRRRRCCACCLKRSRSAADICAPDEAKGCAGEGWRPIVPANDVGAPEGTDPGAGDMEPEAGEDEDDKLEWSGIEWPRRARSKSSSSSRSRCFSRSISCLARSSCSRCCLRNSCCSRSCFWRSVFSLACFLNCWKESVMLTLGRFGPCASFFAKADQLARPLPPCLSAWSPLWKLRNRKI